MTAAHRIDLRANITMAASLGSFLAVVVASVQAGRIAERVEGRLDNAVSLSDARDWCARLASENRKADLRVPDIAEIHSRNVSTQRGILP